MEPRALLEIALDTLRQSRDVEHAEARWQAHQSERARVRDGRPEALEESREEALGVRVLCGGRWGFAATSALTPEAVAAAARLAREIARAAAGLGAAPVRLAEREQPPAVGRYETPVGTDPFGVSLDDKLGRLQAVCARAQGAEIRTAVAQMQWFRTRKHLLTLDGVDVAQTFTYGGGGVHCIAADAQGQTQPRSYLARIDADAGAGGYERLCTLALEDNAERVREEARALLTADPTPAGRRTLLVGAAQLALQVHESCGHPTELDRALGTEISLAGGSFLQPAHLGAYRYGSPRVNLTADATVPGGLGTFGWDDEGTPARRVPLVERGLFVGYLSSRETAAALGLRPSGAMRASSGLHQPLVRMVNVNLDPDPQGPTLEELVADTDDGIFLDTNRSWSIDDLRLNFHFGCELAWEIRHGRRVRLLRGPMYTGLTPRFWGGLDAVCGPSEWRLFGVMNCGKGEPMQLLPVGHGVAPARFRDVEVGHG